MNISSLMNLGTKVAGNVAFVTATGGAILGWAGTLEGGRRVTVWAKDKVIDSTPKVVKEAFAGSATCVDNKLSNKPSEWYTSAKDTIAHYSGYNAWSKMTSGFTSQKLVGEAEKEKPSYELDGRSLAHGVASAFILSSIGHFALTKVGASRLPVFNSLSSLQIYNNSYFKQALNAFKGVAREFLK